METVDYCENDGGEFDESHDADSDWGSKIVWNNYHRFKVGGCILVGVPGRPASLTAFSGATFHIDSLPESYQKFLNDELAFTSYLLGHDSVADHHISFGIPDNNGYPFDWTGKIALSCAGEAEFRHSFEVHTHVRPLSEINVRCDCSQTEAQKMLASLLVEASYFKYDSSSSWPQFVLKS